MIVAATTAFLCACDSEDHAASDASLHDAGQDASASCASSDCPPFTFQGCAATYDNALSKVVICDSTVSVTTCVGGHHYVSSQGSDHFAVSIGCYYDLTGTLVGGSQAAGTQFVTSGRELAGCSDQEFLQCDQDAGQ